MDNINIIMEFYKEQLAFCRHVEGQRSTMTNIILVVTAILLGFTFNDGVIIKSNWPFPALIILIGIFSYLFSMKHYERFKLHDKLSDRYREIIEKMVSEADVNREEINAELSKEFGVIHNQRLNAYWKGIPVAVTVLGIGSLALLIVK